MMDIDLVIMKFRTVAVLTLYVYHESKDLKRDVASFIPKNMLCYISVPKI